MTAELRPLRRNFSPRRLWLFAAACLVCLSRGAAAQEATLFWHSQDALSGTLESFDGSTLTWNSPLFADPLKIELSALASVRFAQAERLQDSGDALQILLRNGDVLTGEIAQVSAGEIAFTSKVWGRFTLARDQILSLQKGEQAGVIYAGPRGLKDWIDTPKPAGGAANAQQNALNELLAQQALAQAQLVDRVGRGRGGVQLPAPAPAAVVAAPAPPRDWTESPDGELSTNASYASIFLPLELPERFQVEAELASTKLCVFSLILGADRANQLRVQTWIDEVVLACGNEFVQVTQMQPGQQSVRFKIYVDRVAGVAMAMTPTGEVRQLPLGPQPVRNQPGNPPGKLPLAMLSPEGITLKREENDLTLRRLWVKHWDGRPPVASDENLTQIADASGKVWSSSSERIDADTGELVLRVDGEDVRIPLAGVLSWTQSRDPEIQRAAANVPRLSWTDGTHISSGDVTVARGEVILRTHYAQEPLRRSLQGMSRIVLANLARKIDAPDRLEHPAGALRGSLSMEDESGSPIRFRPIGGINASPLRSGGVGRILRSGAGATDGLGKELAEFPDTLTLLNNDVLPCRIVGCTREELLFASPFCTATSLPVSAVRAVEFAAAEGGGVDVMRQPGWQGGEADPARGFLLSDNRVIGHPQLLAGNSLEFQASWKPGTQQYLELALFGNGTIDDPLAARCNLVLSTDRISFTFTNDQVARGEARLTAARWQQSAPPNADPAKRFVADVAGNTATIRITRSGNTVTVLVDGQELINYVRQEEVPASPGFAMRSSLLMLQSGNAAAGLNARDAALLQARMEAERIAARQQQQLQDAVRNQNINLRLIAAANPPVDPESPGVVTIGRMRMSGSSGRSMLGGVSDELRDLMLTVPRFRRDDPFTHLLVAANGDLLRGRLSGLDDKQVMFQAGLETLPLPRERVRAVIWLHPEQYLQDPAKIAAAPAAAPAQAAPAAAGNPDAGPAAVPPPENGIQAVLADGHQLTMSPSRLLGGYLQGTTPLLGECRVPAAGIRELYLGDPESRNHLVAFSSWTPRFSKDPQWNTAPAGGENAAAAALLGTVPEDFALPMLDGTTFRLREHQDKIVVLDFWASWCGPCVMALPEYIDTLGRFEKDQVLFVGVNLEEPADLVREFLAERGFELPVALDRGGAIARQFAVNGIPHTVILGKGNVLEDLHIGYLPGTADTLDLNIRAMLDGTWKRPDPPAAPEKENAETPDRGA